MSGGRRKIHQHIKSKLSFGNYEGDDILFVLVPLGVGFNLHIGFIPILGVGIAGFWLMTKYSKMKATKIRGFKKHLRYKYPLFTKDPETLPKSHIKEFNGN